MSTGKLLLGVLGGVAAGALLGVLFAPDEGKNTRKKITDKGNDLAGGLKGKVEDLFKNIKNHNEEFLSHAKDLAANKK